MHASHWYEEQALTLIHPCHVDSAEVFTVDQQAMLAFYLVGIVWFLSRYVSEDIRGTDSSCEGVACGGMWTAFLVQHRKHSFVQSII